MRQLLNDYRGDQSQTSPRKLFFLGSPGAAVFDHHFRYSCTPFFQERQQELGIGLPEGLLLVDAKEPIACGPGDFFICFDPDESARALIEYYTSNIPKEACLLLNYENPVAYHYRKWRFESEILDKFAYVFSSAAHFCDGKKFFWIPAWNFVNDFETNKTIRALECLPSPKSSFLVVNPILTGLDVHRRRLEIISEFVAHRRSFDIFGHQSMLEHPLTQAWKACYRGALPFAPQPYRFEKKLDVFRSYKFTLVIENTFIDGYLSEKLAEPLAVLSVPVYFGAPDISRFMPELFEAGVINGHRFNSTAALIRYLEELSDEEYESRQRCIESHRSDYFALTSRYNIWN
ncbi:MAG: hypothetical protein KDD62_12720, partial [Bdellovibrionales bacterium]|nr:hypothetical protein [Bdellovibrionales bacterium]